MKYSLILNLANMPTIKERISAFTIPKFKFAGTSGIATIVDYLIFISLFNLIGLSDDLSQAIAVASGMITNFILQKKYVFRSKRRIWSIFLLSVAFSFLGYFLNLWLFSNIQKAVALLAEHKIFAKLCVTAIMFLYNFYTKRFSFEKSFPGASQKS